ncbi:MAG: hypothetical protein GF313_04295, partial [Caldithrix sp.]|nr:hypothetical protein [Caldithrix sp.]
MFYAIFSHEIKYWLKNPTLYIYLFFFLILSTMTMAGFAGIFGEGSVESSSVANSPWNLYSLFKLYGKLLLFLAPTIIGHSIYRDYKSNMHTLLYSYPFHKAHYLFGKFLGSFSIVVLISLMLGSGFVIGTQLPGVNSELIQPFDWITYIQVYIIYLIPNLYIVGAVVFSIVIISRNIYAGFISVIIIMIVREIFGKLSAGFDSIGLAAMLGPLAEFATTYYTNQWTITEQNYKMLPLARLIIINRVVWVGFASLLFALTYRRFSFSLQPFSFRIKKLTGKRLAKSNFRAVSQVQFRNIRFNHSWLNHIKSAWTISVTDFKYLISRGYFVSLTLVGIILVTLLLAQMNPQYETRILPVTWVMLAFPVFFISLLIEIITFLFAGFLVHRSKTSRMDALLDVTPVPDWVFVFSRITALVKIQILLLTGTMAAGILVQIFNDYYHFEVGLYLSSLLGIHLLKFVIWAIAAVFIHILVNNTYLGFFILLIFYFGLPQLSAIGLYSPLYQFNQDPQPGFFLYYSDLSGYGHALIPYLIYKFYWLVFSFILIGGSLVFWIRGVHESLKDRLSAARLRLNGSLRWSVAIFIFFFLVLGFWIFNEENKTNFSGFRKTSANINNQVDKKYKKYNRYPQPRITNVRAQIDLYPESRSFASSGNYTLVNKTQNPIDTLLIRSADNMITSWQLSRNHKIAISDKVINFDIVQLNSPLLPGDSLNLSFQVENIPNTLLKKNSPIIENGTFLTSSIHPEIGYYVDQSNTFPTDSLALFNHYRAIDADFVELELVISTSADQTAIASGMLQEKWTKNGRNFYRYNSGPRATRDFSICSGRYEIAKDTWNNVELIIYHHKDHAYNLSSMFNGLKAMLTYHENNIGKYPHMSLKVVEYSRTIGNYAQSFAGAIMWSEISFILDVQKETALNLPFLGAAHELAHQWWGHQVIPADVMGARLITESMAEYLSLKVFEENHSKQQSRKLLNKTLDIYIKGGKNDTSAEWPLILNEGLKKTYISYQKGALVLNAINKYLGNKLFNQAIRDYYQSKKLQDAPYTTSFEMVDVLRQYIPDSLKYLIHDLFETVTFYDNKALTGKVELVRAGGFVVELDFLIRKYREDNAKTVIRNDTLKSVALKTSGQYEKEGSLPLADYVEIGLFKGDSAVYLQKHIISSIQNKIKIHVDEKPDRFIIDPNFLL